MNKIVRVESVDGGCMVEARTPDGMQLVVFDYGPRKRVIRSDRWEGCLLYTSPSPRDS